MIPQRTDCRHAERGSRCATMPGPGADAPTAGEADEGLRDLYGTRPCKRGEMGHRAGVSVRVDGTSSRAGEAKKTVAGGELEGSTERGFSLSKAVASAVRTGKTNAEWSLPHRQLGQQDRGAVAKGLKAEYEGARGDQCRDLMDSISEKFRYLSPKDCVQLLSRGGELLAVERVAAIFHLGLHRRWGAAGASGDNYKLCWELSTMQSAVHAMQEFIERRSQCHKEVRPTVIIDPGLAEASSEGSQFPAMWTRRVGPDIVGADKVVMPFLEKAPRSQPDLIGHWRYVTWQRAGFVVRVHDSAYRADIDTEKRFSKYISTLSAALGSLWGRGERRWRVTGTGPEGITQRGEVTCGPRCLLGVMREVTNEEGGEVLDLWQKDIYSFEDFVLRQVSGLARVVPPESNEESDVYEFGAAVSRAPPRKLSSRSGRMAGDAVMINSDGEREYESDDEAAAREGGIPQPEETMNSQVNHKQANAGKGGQRGGGVEPGEKKSHRQEGGGPSK